MSLGVALGGDLTGEFVMKTARLWQSEAYNKWVGRFPKPRMTVKAATGSGKTRLAVMVIMDWIHRHNKAADGKRVGKVVFFVPGKSLVAQTMAVMDGFQISAGRVSSQFHETGSQYDVYICTYGSIDKLRKTVDFDDKKVLVIGDEAHRIGAEKTAERMETFQGDGCLLLSATPERDDGVSVMDLMNAPIGHELDLLTGIEQSRRDQDSLDFTFHIVHVQPTIEEAIVLQELGDRITQLGHVVRKKMKDCGAPYPNNLQHKGNLPYLDGDGYGSLMAWKTLCMERKRYENDCVGRMDVAKRLLTNNVGSKLALFHESIFGIERFAKLCRAEGIRPHIFHSGSTPSAETLTAYPELNNPKTLTRIANYGKQADQSLQRWARSAGDVLLTCKSLKEGFNCPDLQGLVMMTGTNSHRSRIQTIGRVFRGTGHKDIWFVKLQGSAGDAFALDKLMHETGLINRPQNIKHDYLSLPTPPVVEEAPAPPSEQTPMSMEEVYALFA